MPCTCKNCWFAQNPDDAHYCGKCGKSLSRDHIWKLYDSYYYTPVGKSTLREYKTYEQKVKDSWWISSLDKFKIWWKKDGEDYAWIIGMLLFVVGVVFFCFKSCSDEVAESEKQSGVESQDTTVVIGENAVVSTSETPAQTLPVAAPAVSKSSSGSRTSSGTKSTSGTSTSTTTKSSSGSSTAPNWRDEVKKAQARLPIYITQDDYKLELKSIQFKGSNVAEFTFIVGQSKYEMNKSLQKSYEDIAVRYVKAVKKDFPSSVKIEVKILDKPGREISTKTV